MAYSIIQENHLYSVYFAPRGKDRLTNLAMQVSQRHLGAFDRLIGIIGEPGSGKSIFCKGMFPGMELSNDDNGVNVRPLPILDMEENRFYSNHTYHLDIRFEMAFTQLHVLADAVREALDRGKRVIVEHFDLLYPMLGINAELLIGVGEEAIVTRPTVFGPLPNDIADVVFKSNKYRQMAHTAEDITERYLWNNSIFKYEHGDVRHGFLLKFDEKPELDINEMQDWVLERIQRDIPVSYVDEEHIMFGDKKHHCTGPRVHVRSTGQIENFRFVKEIAFDPMEKKYYIVGLVGNYRENVKDLNTIDLEPVK